MVERVRLPAPPPRKRGLTPGHRLSIGNRGPAVKAEKRFLTAALINELARIVDPKRRMTNTHKIVEKLVSLAAVGDLTAIKDIFDRIEGKPAQSITQEIVGKDGGPIRTITANMSIEEAERVYQDTINGVYLTNGSMNGKIP